MLLFIAFSALLQHNIRSAPLWDSCLQQYVGMLTITDFIQILCQSYKSPNAVNDELEHHQIQTWRALAGQSRHTGLQSVDPSASIYDGMAIIYLFIFISI